MPIFECRTELQTSPETLFGFLINPRNLEQIAPPEIQLSFVDPPSELQLGCRLTCRAQAYGMVQQLIYEIVEFEAPNQFREKLIDGPLKRWVHDYLVEPHERPGHVTLVNRIDFEPPGGLLGFIVTADKLREALEDGFEHRRVELQKLFGKPNG